jgi:hypothetical protein
MLLTNGEIADIGEPKDIISRYVSSDRISGRIDLRDWSEDRSGNGPMRILYLNTQDENKQIRSQFEYGEPIIFNIGVSGQPGAECILGVSIRNTLGHLILHFSNLDDSAELILPSAESEIRMCLQENILNDETYYVTVFLGDGFNLMNDRVHNCLLFTVDSTMQGRVVCNSPVRFPARWELHQAIE